MKGEMTVQGQDHDQNPDPVPDREITEKDLIVRKEGLTTAEGTTEVAAMIEAEDQDLLTLDIRKRLAEIIHQKTTVFTLFLIAFL